MFQYAGRFARLMFAAVCVLGAARSGQLCAEEGRQSEGFAGSVSCRQCHENFYELWAPSHHGLAMQPYSEAFARANLTAQDADIVVGEYRYRAAVDANEGWVTEDGPQGRKRYPIEHVMGGKNVYFFLTSMERGRLQTLPVAYDVNKRRWYDMAAAGVRHFVDVNDEALDWRDWPYTFNTACYSCHVSQLEKNYDLDSDTYRTAWTEPGINCETCHGSGVEHVRVCQALGEGEKPEDIEILSTKNFNVEQVDGMCGPCHAKAMPLTASFEPGGRYFDHYDLVTLEDRDFYADGRDLGENYTYTTWRMSPCFKSGKLDCIHCHTSSGRYRFSDAVTANNACLPCHADRVNDVTAHAHHEPESGATRCIACHMPMTSFARMNRSDHSMRPPAPAATLAYKSPNACNICHSDKDAKWSDEYVRKWHDEDYQKPMLEAAALVDAGRRQDWSKLDQMLSYLRRDDRDEVFANSLIRLLRFCESAEKWPVILSLLESDDSPLIRASAADALENYLTPESLQALLAATRDGYRLVRVRAASSLAGIPAGLLNEKDRTSLTKAMAEWEACLRSRPDDFASHYNLGNYYLQRGKTREAIASFERSIKFHSENYAAMVNVSMAYNAIGDNENAEKSLRKAIAVEPNNPAAYVNLGMLLGELDRMAQAEKIFREALRIDPNTAAAAYNLGVILASSDPDECLEWCMKAFRLRPDNTKYGYTYAWYLNRSGRTDTAITVLQGMIARRIANMDVYMFLGDILAMAGRFEEAAVVYRRGAENTNLSPEDRSVLRLKTQQIAR